MLQQQSEIVKFHGLTYVVDVLTVHFYINNHLFTPILFPSVLKLNVVYV